MNEEEKTAKLVLPEVVQLWCKRPTRKGISLGLRHMDKTSKTQGPHMDTDEVVKTKKNEYICVEGLFIFFFYVLEVLNSLLQQNNKSKVRMLTEEKIIIIINKSYGGAGTTY